MNAMKNNKWNRSRKSETKIAAKENIYYKCIHIWALLQQLKSSQLRKYCHAIRRENYSNASEIFAGNFVHK